MGKRIAVVIRDNQTEGLRVSGGISVLGDDVTIFVLDHRLSSSPDVAVPLDMIREVGLPVVTNIKGYEPFAFSTAEEIAERLLDQDVVLSF